LLVELSNPDLSGLEIIPEANGDYQHILFYPANAVGGDNRTLQLPVRQVNNTLLEQSPATGDQSCNSRLPPNIANVVKSEYDIHEGQEDFTHVRRCGTKAASPL
jgi:hypothetical protein